MCIAIDEDFVQNQPYSVTTYLQHLTIQINENGITSPGGRHSLKVPSHFLLRHFCMLLLWFTSPVTVLYNLLHLCLPQNQSENITYIFSDMNSLDCFTLGTKLIIAYLFSCCFTVVCFTCSVTILLKV
jgi:hypothetical protein